MQLDDVADGPRQHHEADHRNDDAALRQRPAEARPLEPGGKSQQQDHRPRDGADQDGASEQGSEGEQSAIRDAPTGPWSPEQHQERGHGDEDERRLPMQGGGVEHEVRVDREHRGGHERHPRVEEPPHDLERHEDGRDAERDVERDCRGDEVVGKR